MNQSKLFKTLLTIALTVSIIFINSNVLADDYIEEDDFGINLEPLETEVASTIADVPTINARHAVVYDRASGKVLFRKKRNRNL